MHTGSVTTISDSRMRPKLIVVPTGVKELYFHRSVHNLSPLSIACDLYYKSHGITQVTWNHSI